jgi:hypothetical protein
MTTDLEIQKWVYAHHGFVPEPAWIAYCKRMCGILMNSVRDFQAARFSECSPDKRLAIKQAFRHF